MLLQKYTNRGRPQELQWLSEAGRDRLGLTFVRLGIFVRMRQKIRMTAHLGRIRFLREIPISLIALRVPRDSTVLMLRRSPHCRVLLDFIVRWEPYTLI